MEAKRWSRAPLSAGGSGGALEGAAGCLDGSRWRFDPSNESNYQDYRYCRHYHYQLQHRQRHHITLASLFDPDAADPSSIIAAVIPPDNVDPDNGYEGSHRGCL